MKSGTTSLEPRVMPPASVRAALIAIIFPLAGTTVFFRLIPLYNLEAFLQPWLVTLFVLGMSAVLKIPGKLGQKFGLGLLYLVSFWVIAESLVGIYFPWQKGSGSAISAQNLSEN